MVKADDPGVLFAGCGETTTGEKGHVLRTTDFGETWEILPLPTQPNATVWGLVTHPADPTALWRLACWVRSTSVRMPARPGARSRVNSARSGPQSGCQTNFHRPDQE